MNLNKLTEKAQEAIVAAQQLAENRQHTQLEPEHLLHALVSQADGVVPTVLQRLGLDWRQLIQRLESTLNGFARAARPGQQLYVSSRFRRVFEAAQQEAERLKDDYVSTEHLLIAMTDEDVLRQLGVTRDRVLQAMQEVRGTQRVTSQNPEATYQSLEKYGRDLTTAPPNDSEGDRPAPRNASAARRVSPGDTIVVDIGTDGELVFERAGSASPARAA